MCRWTVYIRGVIEDKLIIVLFPWLSIASHCLRLGKQCSKGTVSILEHLRVPLIQFG